MKHVLILEDNKNTLEALAQAVSAIGNIHVCKAGTVDEVYRLLFDYRIDVFLLDIILTTKVPGDTSGIRFAKHIRANENYLFTPIIFTTALADPEIYAYRNLHSYGYLEKPFDMEEVIRLVKDALRYEPPEPKSQVEYFRKDGILIAVDVKQVLYAEVRNHILTIHMANDMLSIPYVTIKQFLLKCNSVDFVQCSRNTVVNRMCIKSIDMTNRYIQLTDETQVEIGMTFAKKLVVEKRHV